MSYYESPKQSFRHFCNENHLNAQRQSLQTIIKKLSLNEHKEKNTSSYYVVGKIRSYIKNQKDSAMKQLRDISEANEVLTKDETTLVVSTCREISLMGLGIDEDTCLYDTK